MHILDDPGNSPRVARLLAARGERLPRTPPAQIRESANAVGPDGPLPVVPEELIEAALAFEDRWGGLAYRPKPTDNHMEYGLDGEAYFSWSDEHGWMMPALIDGAWTWGMDVLLDGRTVMGPGEWPERVIDRSLEQRLEHHALLFEVSEWPHVTFTRSTSTGIVPDLGVPGIPPVPEATGPADHWWHDGDRAVHLTLGAWPAGEDEWVTRCFARDAHHLPAVVSQVDSPGEFREWCPICCRFLRPGLPRYEPQGGPGHCRPTGATS